MYKALMIFAFLQLADLATTLVVFRLGGTEENPLVQHFMAVGPVLGVVIAKALALALGAGFVVAAKHRALRIANFAFAAIVVWNLSVIVRLA